MTLFWIQMGHIRYPLLIVAVLLLAQTGRAIGETWGSGDHAGTSLRTHSILVLGVLAACVGLLGTLVGIMLTAASIEQAGQVHSVLVWGGVKVALTSAVVGFLMLGFAAMAWLSLQYVRGRRGVTT